MFFGFVSNYNTITQSDTNSRNAYNHRPPIVPLFGNSSHWFCTRFPNCGPFLNRGL